MANTSYRIQVRVDGELVDCENLYVDCISIIRILRLLSDVGVCSCHPDRLLDEYDMFIELPWDGNRLSIGCDAELLGAFELFARHRIRKLVFAVERKGYVPNPPSTGEGSGHIPDPVPIDMEGEFQEMRYGDSVEQASCDSDAEADIPLQPQYDQQFARYMFGGDLNQGVGDDQGGEGLGGVQGEGIGDNKGSEGVNDGNQGRDGHEGGQWYFDDKLHLFEGYQSNDDEVLPADFGDDDDDDIESSVARLMKGIPFERDSGGKISFHVLQTHDSVYSLRATLKEYAIQEGISFIREKNDKDRICYKCSGVGCPWRIFASVMKDDVTMQIKRYNDVHHCHRSYKSVEAKVSWIASKFEALVKTNPDIKVGVMKEILQDRFRVNVDRQRLYKAKQKALAALASDHAQSFKHLRRYAYMIRHYNPGSIAYIKIRQPEPTFQRFMVSYEAQKEGFKAGCRPFVGVDGCHLKGPYKGVLLSAVALDANNGLFPLAVCVCESEKDVSWSWFLQNLKRYLDLPSDQPITFMSDRQKGLGTALDKHWPEASTRFCARHIYANFRKTYPTQVLKNLFWEASRSSNSWGFANALGEIGKINPKARTWLEEIDPKHWSRHAFDPRIKCDHVTNNMTESFNSMLGGHRAKTYLELLEHIRRMLMQRFHAREQHCAKWATELPPFVNRKIIQSSLDGREMTVLDAGRGEFEVVARVGRAYVTKLQEQYCECGAWQISGVPCVHAVACIATSYNNAQVSDVVIGYVHPFLTKNAFQRTYKSMIHPIPDFRVWPEIATQELLPPIIIVLPGRPKLQRVREPDERAKEPRGSSVTCTLCGATGHNKRTCRPAGKDKGKAKDSTNSSGHGNGSSKAKVASSNSNSKNRPASKRKRSEVGSSSQSDSQRRCQSQLTVELN